MEVNMKVSTLIEEYGFERLSGKDDHIINGLYTCDLLSWVMSKGKENMGWITVQTHTNILAVASLLEFACIIIPENIKVEEDTIKKAIEEEITILSTSLENSEIYKIFYQRGEL